jgi:hypothetical protein
VKDEVPKDDAGTGDAPETLDEVGGCTRLRIDARVGMVSSTAGVRLSERVLAWVETARLVPCETLRDEETAGEVDIS